MALSKYPPLKRFLLLGLAFILALSIIAIVQHYRAQPDTESIACENQRVINEIFDALKDDGRIRDLPPRPKLAVECP
jgi:hypothetical protein